jgi:hypothetical protein
MVKDETYNAWYWLDEYNSIFLFAVSKDKNNFVMMKSSDFTMEEFEAFLDDSYSMSRGYVKWSLPIVGHWESDSLFYQDSQKISVGFFDLDYDYNARNIHEMFMDAHYEEEVNDINHPCTVNGLDGWYIGGDVFSSSNEVSFSYKVYIIAVNSYYPDYFSEEELTAFARDLQIWDLELTDTK